MHIMLRSAILAVIQERRFERLQRRFVRVFGILEDTKGGSRCAWSRDRDRVTVSSRPSLTWTALSYSKTSLWWAKMSMWAKVSMSGIQ